MCSAENYSVVGPCTPNFRASGGAAPGRGGHFSRYGIDFYPLIGISSRLYNNICFSIRIDIPI